MSYSKDTILGKDSEVKIFLGVSIHRQRLATPVRMLLVLVDRA